jgi:diguanylate cyclase (GGDEF)-like protein
MPADLYLSDNSLHESTGSVVTHATTPLRQLLDEWNPDSVSHRLVKNECGLIDGIVDLHYIQRMVAADNPVERTRWEGVTAGAVADYVFIAPSKSQPDAELQCSAAKIQQGTPIYDASGCVAIVANGETYVSWSRVSAAMQQNQFDLVTQLPTRLAFNRRLKEEINRSTRSKQPLAVMLIDLDYFKQINDQFGHSAGDATLLLIADSLRTGLRSYDFVARFAGDEFVVICYDCKPQDIELPIIRLRETLAARSATAANPAIRVSLSIGVAVLTGIDARCPPELIVEQADNCLYQAKRAGRATAYAIELNGVGIPVAPAYEIRRNN